jgi:hypothetical protein
MVVADEADLLKKLRENTHDKIDRVRPKKIGERKRTMMVHLTLCGFS